MSDDSHRQGVTPLTLAWLALLAIVTAGSTYVLLAHQASAPSSDSPLGVTLAIVGTDENGRASEPDDPSLQPPDGDDAAVDGTVDGTAAKASDEPVQPADRPAADEPVADEPPADTPLADDPPASPTLAPAEVAVAQDADLPAWRRYASIYQATTEQPRIAVVLTGLGFSSRATEAAIQDLPPGVTLSFTPYARKLAQWIALARGNGHEVMLDLPMEPVTYPDDDPGPRALLTQLDELQNQERLRWVIGRAHGYVGLAATMGSRFTSSEPHLKPVLQEIKDQGLMFLDNQASSSSVAARVARDIDLPHAVNDRTLDEGDVGHLTIDARLAQVERVALSDGASVAIGRPYPATLERLREWVKTLESKGFELVPITVLAQHSR